MAVAREVFTLSASLEGWAAALRKIFPSQLEGFLDRIIADEAVGWAFDRRRPNRRVLIVARRGRKIVAETLADLPRRDLEGAGKGDGRCGFRLRLPGNLLPDERASLRIEAVAGLRRTPLKKAGRFRIEFDSRTSEPVNDSHRGPAAGFLERYSGRTLKGWAVDPNNPETPPQVDVFEGELFLGSTPADIDRPRLRQSGAPAGARGFEFIVPLEREVRVDLLRGRVSGTRFDLRQSRSYPGGGPSAFEPQPSKGIATAVQADPAKPILANRARTSTNRVLLLICGAGSEKDTGTTLSSWANQDWPDTAQAVISPIRPPASPDWFGPKDEDALRAFIDKAHSVVFLTPGQAADSGIARRVFEMDPLKDVLWWPGPAHDPLYPDPDLAIRLGRTSAGLAVRAGTLMANRQPIAFPLAHQGLRAMELWISSKGLSWVRASEALTTSPPNAPAVVPRENPPSLCRRITLAIWSDWEGEGPAALTPLLAGAAGFDVEVLLPEGVAGDVVLARSAEIEGTLKSLQFRRVSSPPHLGLPGRWRALTEAATGQLVVLCAGQVTPAPESVRDCILWAGAPDVGCVTVPIQTPSGDELAGLPLQAEAGATALVKDRPVIASPAAFMVVSKAALSESGGFDASSVSADLDLGRALRQNGRRSVLLGNAPAAAPRDALARWLPLGTDSLSCRGAAAQS